MRYARMLTNSILGGALGAACLSLLVLQLNPHFPIDAGALASLYTTLFTFYGVHLTVFFYGLIVVRQMFGAEVLSPGWLSVRILAWVSAGVTAMASTLMWLNLWGLQSTLGDEAARRMASGAAVLAVGSLVIGVVAILHFSFGRRGSRVSAGLFTATLAASLTIALILRGPASPEVPALAVGDAGPGVFDNASSPHVRLILLDGASLDYISVAASEGRLPNFGRILDGGASMYLQTIRPTQPAPVWTSVATGKLPPLTGVRSAASYRPLGGRQSIDILPDFCFSHALLQVGLIEERALDATARRAKALWEMLGEQGVSVGIVGWPLTYPASPVNGFLVSDRVQLSTLSVFDLDDPRLAYPPDRVAAARLAIDQATLTTPPAAAVGSTDGDDVPRAPTPRDLAASRLATELTRDAMPTLLAVRYQSLDTVGHRFLRYAMPAAFGDVSDEERRRFGRVLDQHYSFIDREVGAAMGQLRGDDLLVVVAAFGMEPLMLAKRLLARMMGDPTITATHERGPDGFLLAYGRAAAAGRRPPGLVTDVAATVLYYLGLPVARDMDGDARTDLFRPAYTATRPIAYIPSYQ